MRMRSLTTWAYAISLLCVAAPSPIFGDSLGDAASAEERRRAAREASTPAGSSSKGSGKGAGVEVSDSSGGTSTTGGGRGVVHSWRNRSIAASRVDSLLAKHRRASRCPAGGSA